MLQSGMRACTLLHRATEARSKLALEQLAAFSLLARWVDQADVLTA